MNAAPGTTWRARLADQPDRSASEARAPAPRMIGLALVLGIGLLAYHVAVRFDLASLLGAWDWWAIVLFRTQTTAFAIAMCVAFVDRRAASHVHARPFYVAAVVAGNAAAAGAALALLHWTDLPYRGPTEARWVLYIQLEYMLLAGGAVFAVLDRRRARAAHARLHEAQRRQLGAARRNLDARLQAMQARVEPRFLFDTLADVQRLHATDDRRAGRLLDALIAYLRAAMPRAPDRSRTVRQEVELVRAWLALAAGAPEGGFDHRIDVAAAAVDFPLPPMLLLPLVRAVVADGKRRAPTPPSLRLAIRVAGATLEVRLATTATTATSVTTPPIDVEATLERLRKRLLALYGTAASLFVRAGPPGSLGAVLCVPLDCESTGALRAATDRSASSDPASTGSSRAAAAADSSAKRVGTNGRHVSNMNAIVSLITDGLARSMLLCSSKVLASGPCAGHRVVQACPAGHEAFGLGVVHALDEPHELRGDVAVEPRRTERVLHRQDARREHDEVDRVDAGHGALRLQHEEDRRVGVVVADRPDDVEALRGRSGTARSCRARRRRPAASGRSPPTRACP